MIAGSLHDGNYLESRGICMSRDIEVEEKHAQFLHYRPQILQLDVDVAFD